MVLAPGDPDAAPARLPRRPAIGTASVANSAAPTEHVFVEAVTMATSEMRPATDAMEAAGPVVNASQRAEIDAMRAEAQPTLRPTVPAIEALLYEPIPVLDHGF